MHAGWTGSARWSRSAADEPGRGDRNVANADRPDRTWRPPKRGVEIGNVGGCPTTRSADTPRLVGRSAVSGQPSVWVAWIVTGAPRVESWSYCPPALGWPSRRK